MSSKDKLRVVIRGAIKNYRGAHGDTVVNGTNWSSLEKRLVGAVWTALHDGQLDVSPPVPPRNGPLIT